MIGRAPVSEQSRASAASDVYKGQGGAVVELEAEIERKYALIERLLAEGALEQAKAAMLQAQALAAQLQRLQ